MAITGKLKKDAYHVDGADKAAKSIDFAKIKAEAKNAAKKLVNSTEPGTKTPFFVKKDYFKNPKDATKSIGHFLAIGDSNLDKEFKKEKTAADVAYGNFFVKELNGKKTAHFEYVTGQGKLKKAADWKPLLKEFKKAVKLPCVFVVDGQTVEDDDKEEDTTKEGNDKAPQVNLDALIKKAQEIKTAVAAKKITKEIIETAQKWVEKFKDAAAEATPELKKDAQLINQLVAKVAAKREQGGKGGDSTEAAKQLEKLQKDITALIDGLGGTDALKKMADVA